MPDFNETLGYDIPDIDPVKSDSFEYYKHQPGIYKGVFGKITAKYKDIEGKRCESTEPGAKLSHFVLALWITEYLGNSSNPQKKPVLAIAPDGFHLPKVEQVAELYFPFTISIDPKMQWTIQQKFENFRIEGHKEATIVTVNPSKPTEKFTNFKAFPFYFGSNIEFTLAVGKQKGGIFLQEIKLMGGKHSPDVMIKLEDDFNDLLKREQEARKASNTNDFTPPPPPPTDFSDLENEYLN